jgi:hypothetical protein
MATTLRPGMEVLGCDGHKIGTVHRLFSGAAWHPTGETPEEIDLDPVDDDKERPGEVAPVYDAAFLGTAEYGSSQASAMAPFPTSDTPGAAPLPEGAMSFSPSNTKYMEVRHHGILGRQRETIYVPLSAVDAIVDHTITLSCTRDEAVRRYGDQPAPEEAPAG